ncbi:MAG: putative basic amino acid antiporter YfcC [Calditrichaeota bacterium]|nr:MAG: putative basic amino acid antiporter YfcC [Calditrichota bacterium]
MMTRKKRAVKTVNTVAMIYALVIIVALLTFIIPGGEYQRVVQDGRTLVVPGSFRYIPNIPQGLGAMLTAPIKGFVQAAEIIVFLFIIGGAFSIIQGTGAITSGVQRMAHTFSQKPYLKKLFIPISMTLFSLGGTLFGMCEETMPFVLIFIPLSLSMGYDRIVGIAIPFLGAAAGFAAAVINPFTVGIASSIAELPLSAGMAYRAVIWVISTFFMTFFVMRYAAKILKNPSSSPTYDMDIERHRETASPEHGDSPLTRRQKWVLIVFSIALLLLIFGVLQFHWFIIEIAAFFLALAMISGVIGKLSVNEFTDMFKSGAKDMIGVVFIISCARALLVVATDARILDVLLYNLASVISHLHPILAAQAMFVTQGIINFFVHSGSGQAMLTMPVMAPLADVIGISRQTAVLAFVFGEGWINPILPTSGVTMGVLGLANVSWSKWARWMVPIQIFFFIVALLLLIPPVVFHWQYWKGFARHSPSFFFDRWGTLPCLSQLTADSLPVQPWQKRQWIFL